MATGKDIAAEYVRRLRAVQEREAERIADEIEELRYTETGIPLTPREKMGIVDEMRKILYAPPEEGITHLGEADARAHLDIVRAIKELLK